MATNLSFMLIRPATALFNYPARILGLVADTQFWPSTDPLGESLHLLRLRGTFYCRSEFSAPWGLSLPPIPDCLWFHVATSGECWLDVENRPPYLLRTGDLALVPHGSGHRLRSAPGIPAPSIYELTREIISDRYEILRHGGGGEVTTMVCGAVAFDHPAAHELVKLLPAMIPITASEPGEADWIQGTLRLMAAEVRGMRPGGETIITRLSDILVIQAIRSWLATDPSAKTGWLGALGDKQIGQAVALIQRDPGRDWSVAVLADAASMSRSAFAARFTYLVGEPAMHYVTRWRMNVALDMLKEGGTVGDLASRLGYQSEAAFSRAFKRIMGTSPGCVRRNNEPSRKGRTGSYVRMEDSPQQKSR